MAHVIHRSIGSVKNSEERSLEWVRDHTSSLAESGYTVRRYAVKDRKGRPTVVVGIGLSDVFLTNVIEITG